LSEGQISSAAKRFEEAEAELTGDVLDAYDQGFRDALAQVACVHPGMDITSFTVSKTGRSFPGSFLALYLVDAQTLFFLFAASLSEHFLNCKLLFTYITAASWSLAPRHFF